MQLPNMEPMELNDRAREALCSHGITESLIFLFLRSCLNKEQVIHYLASAFELSTHWLSELSEEVYEVISKDTEAHALEHLLEYLIQCKKNGWKPKLIFVKSCEIVEHFHSAKALLFVALSKITKTGIAFTAYKAWGLCYDEPIVALSQETGLFYQGVTVEPADFENLNSRRLLPSTVFKKAKDLWFPNSEQAKELYHFTVKIKDLLEVLKVTAIQPTHLHSVLN